ncbi:hypothetical protein ACWGCW_39420 [Streptomyces sp. NPDC054933]
MTAAECQEGLGTKNRFFVKSRFAICSGASFVQTWFQNDKPVGESAFNVLAVGKYSWGGTDMPATRTWAQLLADGAIKHTWTAAVGQGYSGSTGVINTIYQPSVKVTPPAGWKLGGATGGDQFMLVPRWDKASHLNAKATGAAVFSVLTSLQYSMAPGSPERAVAEHINKVFAKPNATKPPNALKKVPGQKADASLTRLYADAK